MGLVQAKCTNCGAALEVDSKKDAAICPFCGSAYIVERAVANYYGNHTTHIVTDTVNIINNGVHKSGTSVRPSAIGTDDQIIKKIQLCNRFDDSIQWLGDYNVLYLKGDGTIGWCSINPEYNEAILNWDVQIFAWKNVKKFLTVRLTENNANKGFCVVALTFDGRCLVSKPTSGGINTFTLLKICHSQNNRYEQVSKWTNIADIIYSGNDIFGLTNNGTVKSTDDSFNAELWNDIKRIGEISNLVYGITSLGKVKLFPCSQLKQYQIEIINKWEGIVCLNGHYLGLTQEGTVLTSEMDDPGFCNLKKVAKLDHGFIHTDGSVTILSYNNRFMHLGHVGLGYVQAAYSELGSELLNQDGRVDLISNFGEIKQRGIAENVIHIFNFGRTKYLYLNNDGTFWNNRRVFLPEYVNQYGIAPSPKIQSDTKSVYLEELNKRKEMLAKRKKELPLFGSVRKNCKERMNETDYEIALVTQKL